LFEDILYHGGSEKAFQSVPRWATFQMDEIAMNQQHPRSAGAIVFRRTGDGVRILVLRAFRNWDFPKGLVEPGESQFEAACREVGEETGLSDFDFPFDDSYRETLPYANSKIARYYLAETQTAEISLPVSPELGRPENHEWRWVSFDEAEDLLPARLVHVLEWAQELLSDE
jgi:8-oxo-dGTP pyrophosphatase MutT (NUDIX family)